MREMNRSLPGLMALLLGLAASAGAAPVRDAIIFDLDDTLVDVSYRTHEILREVGATIPGLEGLLRLSVSDIDFDCGVSVKNAGLDDAAVKAVCRTPSFKASPWGSRFFENAAYIKYDHVMPGATRFLERLKSELKVELIYLSGRDENATGAATRKQVDYFGFPGGVVITQPTPAPSAPSVPDDQFKLDRLKALQTQGYNIIAAFDDKFENAEMFRANLEASVPVVRPHKNILDRLNVKTGKTLADGIEQITDYTVNVSWSGSGPKSFESNSKHLSDILNRARALKKEAQ